MRNGVGHRAGDDSLGNSGSGDDRLDNGGGDGVSVGGQGSGHRGHGVSVEAGDHRRDNAAGDAGGVEESGVSLGLGLSLSGPLAVNESVSIGIGVSAIGPVSTIDTGISGVSVGSVQKSGVGLSLGLGL